MTGYKTKAPRSKPTINSRTKGKTGELELAEVLRANGYTNAHRGQQFHGGGDSPDVMGGPDEFHIECKRTETGNLYKWLEQAKRDAPEGKIPLVVHRKNKQEWVAIMPLQDLLDFILGKAI